MRFILLWRALFSWVNQFSWIELKWHFAWGSKFVAITLYFMIHTDSIYWLDLLWKPWKLELHEKLSHSQYLSTETAYTGLPTHAVNFPVKRLSAADVVDLGLLISTDEPCPHWRATLKNIEHFSNRVIPLPCQWQTTKNKSCQKTTMLAGRQPSLNRSHD